MKRLQSLLLILMATVSSVAISTEVVAESLQLERLTWAGVKMQLNDTTVFIDAVGTDLWQGNAPEGLVEVSADTTRRYALVTHLHNDHFDVETLRRVLGEKGYVICHESMASHIASRGLRVIPAQSYVPISRGGFIFTAVPAQDGFGAKQVSWIVSADDKRLIHAGDTLWHGQWSMIGAQYGPFDVAFLPINGAVVARKPKSEIAAVMTPEQAVDAAVLLRARTMVPIHFGQNDPPNYVEVENALAKTQAHATRRNIQVRHMLPGESLDLSQQ
jgi:L-ascorbate metabolism protein UlaG (beta-lactamase superfamily)